MKKLIKSLLVALLVIMPITFASAKTTTAAEPAKAPDAVNMYVFYGDGCPHCSELETYIKTTLKKDESLKGKLNVIYYEVWNKSGDHAQNIDLFNATGKALGTNPSGVPFYVIGGEFFSGYGESYNQEIVDTINKALSNNKYVDIVQGLIDKMSTKPVKSNPEENIETKEDENKSNTDIVGFVILGVTVVVVLVIVFTKDSDNDDDETVIVEKTTTKKATSTKKTTKKSE